jgi:hypothetical protein
MIWRFSDAVVVIVIVSVTYKEMNELGEGNPSRESGVAV